MTEVMQSIPARLKNVAVGGHVAGADQIIDDEQNKTQETINSEVNTALGNKANKREMSVTPGTGANVDKTTIQLKSGTSATVLTQHQDISGKQDTINDLATIRSGAAAGATAQQPATTLSGYGITDAYTKSETYTKTEVNGLVDTPHQEYETVDAYANLPATGSKDTIYRVSNYNGSTSQVDASVYSEYAWNGTQYIFLCVKSQIGEVFDISAYNNNAKYADLAAALNGGANIPQSLRKGGMSVKFVQSSDNNYVQYVYMGTAVTGSPNPFLDVTNWQKFETDTKITPVDFLSGTLMKDITIDTGSHKVGSSASWKSTLIPVVAGKKYRIKLRGERAQYSFLQNSTFEAGSLPSYATGYYNALIITEDTEVIAPSDATYVVFSEGYSDTRKFPYFYAISNGGFVKESNVCIDAYKGSVGEVTDAGSVKDSLKEISFVSENINGTVLNKYSIDSSKGIIVQSSSDWKVLILSKSFSKGDRVRIQNTVVLQSGFTIAEYVSSPEAGDVCLTFKHYDSSSLDIVYTLEYGGYIAVSYTKYSTINTSVEIPYYTKYNKTIGESVEELNTSMGTAQTDIENIESELESLGILPFGTNIPNLDDFSSPLNYIFKLVSTRRDFYNAADSLVLKKLDFSSDLFHGNCSNLLPVIKAEYTYEWENGIIKFSNPTKNDAECILWVDKYFPFVTTKIGIKNISGGASNTIGVRFGDASQTNYIQARASQSGLSFACYVNGVIVGSNTIRDVEFENCELAIQNTGRKLLAFKIKDGIWTGIGGFDYSPYIDGRQTTLLNTWSTYILASTAYYTAADEIELSSFETILASGSNSVSIRFLTYEDGSFIQNGDCMYYLVEGTGYSISDLYTQICEINFKTLAIRMLGAIFQVRSDGTDEDIILGDDSIKIVYDRNDHKWKGISCGMEYYDYIEDAALRPKLYFETKQNIINGGLIVVKNSIQLKTNDNKNWGTSDDTNGYCEDIDFYFDKVNNNWRLTGNSVANGCKTYRTVGSSLTSGIVLEYSTSSVPSSVRDTGNQFISVGGILYLTSGGTANKLHLRSTGEGLAYIGQLTQDIYLSPNTYGPWCTICPFDDGDETHMFLLSFDRTDLYGPYDHGGLYIWEAFLPSN